MLRNFHEQTSSVLYMDNATPPAPLKLKTSNSVFSPCPSGSASTYYLVSGNYNLLYTQNANQQLTYSNVQQWRTKMKVTLPNTNFRVPAPLMTVSVALYWSPKACLPMHIGFVHPDIKNNQHICTLLDFGTTQTQCQEKNTWDKTRDVFAKDWFSEDSACRQKPEFSLTWSNQKIYIMQLTKCKLTDHSEYS